MVLDTLTNWVGREPTGKPHRIHLHFLKQPVAIEGEDRVRALRTERTRMVGDGTVAGTGAETVWDVQAVYLAVGYRSTPLPGLPFDDAAAVVPNAGGRVLDLAGEPIPGTCVTGWMKRGPIGLIGHTKSDAAETVANLLADTRPTAPQREPKAMEAHLAAAGSTTPPSRTGSGSTPTRSPSAARPGRGSRSQGVRRCCSRASRRTLTSRRTTEPFPATDQPALPKRSTCLACPAGLMTRDYRGSTLGNIFRDWGIEPPLARTPSPGAV
jgi:hypothetical protein